MSLPRFAGIIPRAPTKGNVSGRFTMNVDSESAKPTMGEEAKRDAPDEVVVLGENEATFRKIKNLHLAAFIFMGIQAIGNSHLLP